MYVYVPVTKNIHVCMHDDDEIKLCMHIHTYMQTAMCFINLMGGDSSLKILILRVFHEILIYSWIRIYMYLEYSKGNFSTLALITNVRASRPDSHDGHIYVVNMFLNVGECKLKIVLRYSMYMFTRTETRIH